MTTTRSTKRIALLLGAMSVATLALTSCASMSLEEIKASSHQVIETGYDFWEGESWSYRGADGVEIPLSEDCAPGFWDGNCAGSEDGVFEFRYSKGKGGVIVSPEITVDGVARDAYCEMTEFWDGTYICATPEG